MLPSRRPSLGVLAANFATNRSFSLGHVFRCALTQRTLGRTASPPRPGSSPAEKKENYYEISPASRTSLLPREPSRQPPLPLAATFLTLALSASAQSFTVLHTFTGRSDGGVPQSTLLFDSAGNLYGATLYGGALTACGGVGCGLVYELSPNAGGPWQETTLFKFSSSKTGGYPTATSSSTLAAASSEPMKPEEIRKTAAPAPTPPGETPVIAPPSTKSAAGLFSKSPSSKPRLPRASASSRAGILPCNN